MDSLFRRRSEPPAQASSSNPPYAQPVSTSYAPTQQVFGPPHARPVPYTSGSVPYAQPVGSSGYGGSSLYPRVSVGPTPAVPNAGPSSSGQMPTGAFRIWYLDQKLRSETDTLYFSLKLEVMDGRAILFFASGVLLSDKLVCDTLHSNKFCLFLMESEEHNMSRTRMVCAQLTRAVSLDFVS